MSDIVERLLAGTGGGKHWMDLHEEAADNIKALRERVERAEQASRWESDMCEQALADIKALRQQVADLERDAARYRFLESDFAPMGLNIDGNHVWAYRRNATLKGPSLSAAIDAAISANE